VPKHVGRKLCIDYVCSLVHVISLDMLKLRQDILDMNRVPIHNIFQFM